MRHAILCLRNVTKQFTQNPVPAVKDVTLTLQQGDLLGLVGPSGCGKTTLLRLIAGFERPDLGTLEIAGRTVAARKCWVPPEQRDVGIVFQDYALFPHLNVAENVAFGLQNLQKVKERTAEILALVRLGGLEKRYPHELSGGQQQRVALARALAPQPTLILLDEPLSNLDSQVRLKLREEVREILKVTNTSAILVTHDQEEALAISDWVGVMRQGNLEQLDTPENVYTYPATKFVAQFVTQANFLPARRRGQLWETEIGFFDIALQDSASDAGELMIRQEDLILEPEKNAPAVIQSRRFLGREYRYCLQTSSGQEIHARILTNTVLPVGTKVRLSAARDTVRVFPTNPRGTDRIEREQ